MIRIIAEITMGNGISTKKNEFKDENSEEAYKQSICSNDDEAKHYPKIC